MEGGRSHSCSASSRFGVFFFFFLPGRASDKRLKRLFSPRGLSPFWVPCPSRHRHIGWRVVITRFVLFGPFYGFFDFPAIFNLCLINNRAGGLVVQSISSLPWCGHCILEGRGRDVDYHLSGHMSFPPPHKTQDAV